MLCPHCCQDTLEEQTGAEIASLQPPELIIPPTLSQEKVAHSVKQFAADIWFAPQDLRPQNLHQRLRLLYLPLWLVDSDVQAQWQAQAGFNYQVVSHQERYAGNQWRTQEVQETKVRWEPRLGRLNRRYHNVTAPALDEHKILQQRVGQYDLQAGKGYRPDAAANALIRLPNRSPQDAWPDAEPHFQQRASGDCRTACKADHIRDFRWSSRYGNQHWTQLLTPVYVSHYFDDERQPHPLFINGQTGQVSGRRRASFKKASLYAVGIGLLALGLFLVGLVAAIVGLALGGVPAVIGGGIMLLALMLGIMALAPLFITWRFNRAEKQKQGDWQSH